MAPIPQSTRRPPLHRSAAEPIGQSCSGEPGGISPESDAPRIPMICALTRDSSGFGVRLTETALARRTAHARKQPMERPPRTNLVGGWRGEERTEFVVLADELLGATTSELLEVAQLPLKSGQLFQTREGQDMPGGSEGEEGREELARLWGHALKNVPTESTPHFVQLLDRRDRPGSHPHQCRGVEICNRLVAACQYLVWRAIVTGKVDGKYIEIVAGVAAFLIAYPDVEQIARVLPVERRNSLAGIDLRGGKQAGSNAGREQVLCVIAGKASRCADAQANGCRPLAHPSSSLLMDASASSRDSPRGRNTKSKSTDRRETGAMNRLMAVPPLSAKASVAKTGGTSRSRSCTAR